MSNDRYERIRAALAMRPTPGPWEVVNETDVFTPLGARNAAGVEAATDDGWHIADCDTGPSYTEEGKEDLPYGEKQANAALIAACDPGTIRVLLNERDALVAKTESLREALAVIISWFPSADTYSHLGFDPKTPMQVLKEAKAVLFEENRDDGR